MLAGGQGGRREERDVIIMSHQTVAWQGVVRQARVGVSAGPLTLYKY